jgi:hypothetical protein
MLTILGKMDKVGKINPPTADKILASNALVDEKK